MKIKNKAANEGKSEIKKKYILITAVIASCVIIAAVLCGLLLFRGEQTGEVTQLYLYGDMSEMTSKSDVRSVAAIFMQGEKQISCHAKIKLQGTSSLRYPKKNYTIKFYDDPACEMESAINVGWGEANEYCLKANWIDKTHCRNIVTAQLAAEVQDKYDVLEQAPCNGLIDGFPVEVYINGQFQGLYTWNIPKSAWMFNMNEEDPNHIVMCGEINDAPGYFHTLPTFVDWSVEAGPDSQETWDKFIRLAEFIMNSSDEEFKENFSSYMDLDAALNYYILVDFAYLPDNCGKNMLLVTYDGEIWYPSLYDLDTSWGTNWTGTGLWDYGQKPMEFGKVSNLAKKLETAFPQELHDRYFELREEILTKEHVLELFYAFDGRISEEVRAMEVERWGEDIPGYDISQIEDFLDKTIDRLDEKYENLGK